MPVVEGIAHRLAPLRAPAGAPADIVYDIRGPGARLAALPLPRGTRRRVYDTATGGIDYDDDADVLFVDHDGVLRLVCDPRRGRVDVAIKAAAPGRMLAVNPLFTIPLLELAKRRARYPLHAACVASGNDGLLVTGPSGAGKTTLAVALVRAGYTFLSDDIVFLDRERVIGFPDEVDLTDATVAMFDELADLRGAPLPDGRPKHRVRVEACFGGAVASECVARALVLAEVGDGARSMFEPMDARDALVALAPNVLLTEVQSSQAHLAALGALVRRTPCYRLRSGRDLDATVEQLATLLR